MNVEPGVQPLSMPETDRLTVGEDQDNQYRIENAENSQINSHVTEFREVPKLTEQVVPKPDISSQVRIRQYFHGKLAKEAPQLRFITITNPKQDKDFRTRKIVRSHVARQYHVIRQQAWKNEGDLQRVDSGNGPDQANAAIVAQGYSRQMLRQSTRCLAAAVGPGGSDPFSSCSLPVTPRINILIDHFLTVVGPQMNSFLTSSSNTTDSMKTVYVPFSISDRCVFHGLLLLSARSFAKISGDMSYHVTALTHKAECIRLVNEALGNPRRATSDATIAAVLMLAVEEFLLGNLEVFKAHMCGLHSIVLIRGGLYTLGLGGILEQLALSCDRACEIYMGSRPLFTFLESLSEITTVTALPPGFRNILQSPDISQQIATFVTDANTTSLIKSFCGFEVTTGAELHFSDTCCNSISQHIDQISSPYMITSEAIEVAPTLLVEKCLSYGLLVYYMVMLRSIPPEPYLSSDVGKQLKTTLMRMDLLVHWQGHLDLLLWIAFMGACSATKGPLRDWYMFLLSGVNCQLGTKSWKDIKTILEKFLWARRCDSLGNALWLEVEALSVGSLCLSL